MIGETYEHLDIDPQFVSWVKSDNVLTLQGIYHCITTPPIERK
jgi:hypothetical protein